jgi:hypothetical protein
VQQPRGVDRVLFSATHGAVLFVYEDQVFSHDASRAGERETILRGESFQPYIRITTRILSETIVCRARPLSRLGGRNSEHREQAQTLHRVGCVHADVLQTGS